MKKVALALLVVVSVFMASFAWGSTPFNQSKPATRDQVFRNIISVAQGNFFWEQGASRTPLMIDGFPQWGSGQNEIRNILGGPTSKIEMWGIPVYIYDRGIRSFGIGFIGDKMAFICFDAQLSNMDYYANLVGWAKVNPSKASLLDPKEEDELDLRSVFFFNKGRSFKYKIYSWQAKSTAAKYFPDYIRVVGTKEIAHSAGVL